MGLFSKVKNLLFEEIDETEQIKVVKDESKNAKSEETRKTVMEEAPIARPIQPEKRVEVEKTAPKVSMDDLSERELFKSDNTFPFPDFDEEEFNSMSRTKPKVSKATTNVVEYERKKKVERRTDYGRYEKTEVKEVVEKRKFRPSPIISPVYGILNEDYKVEDIRTRSNDSELDFNSVRKKAFEPEELEEPKTTYYEETVTVKVKEPVEEKIQKVRTIDELLEDTSDVIVNIEEDKRPREELKVEYDDIDDELEEMINQPKGNKSLEIEEDDTLENDLFDLIDSMYDNREEGEL